LSNCSRSFGAADLAAPISLYFHIPFCTKKCPYCHFYVIPNQLRYHGVLKEGLALEWAMQRPLIEGKKIVSIYFGGGTPALFGAEAIGEVLNWISPVDAEITVEANPEDGTLELFSSLKAVGVNRISLGVQSLDDRSLLTLERTHSASKARQAIFNAHAAGIDNISIDLMYDLPDQTESSWRYTLDQLKDLPITHLSLYNLTIEPHTSFSKRKLTFPKPEESLRFLHQAMETMQNLGFDRYEISAFAKPNRQSRHNIGYWTYRPFLGFGPSAFSYWEGERFQNIANLQRYNKTLKEGQSPVTFREKLLYPQNFKEELSVGLRLKQGFALPPEIPQETTKALKELIQNGFLTQIESTVKLTERGKLFYDTVATELI
jgi:oxygen-independent coproporphyrinogen-3 oxidase